MIMNPRNCSHNDVYGSMKYQLYFVPSGREDIHQSPYEQEGLVQFVIDSVYALARGLHNLLSDKCKKGYFKECLRDQDLTGEEILSYIRNVSFIGNLRINTANQFNLFKFFGK